MAVSGGNRLGRIVLLVRDYDEAETFYAGALGFAVLHDSSAQGQRFLHLGLPAQDASGGVGLWLLQPLPGQEDLIGRQAGGQPLMVIYVDDCDAAVSRFVAQGGTVRLPPRGEGEARFAHVLDLYGNELVLVAF
ncbi:putative enzyme related to lactoylglutathione lyase [Luteibacter sp. Sphag1AF]|uniref:VOC family protein n=1 Tax=Luteibacter sp. Sphag1AF TaxID=2587031 RepID=UPI00162237EE|nr:VOC family protein [Luteibacter sp. Sphag1AF]MBB3225565.1 putative enzyme related to lactoylglutathione lyase [Luteibacter sp. Sphag1AF]